ncbi:hypothetical protein DM02DRAFT_726055 [Periconia macrospinosa]|uniref:N-acetyltransferase domain-containing protein n=1 Tax=Periconia macrospinosa TaxID=97972 RepID=A0A2V1E0R3_9PLEO|nr:hypothetical protein DM02DRAFT_726055 [Periconia macrospinosa]
MNSKPEELIVRPANNLQEASDLWWPLIRDLGWNRSPKDGPSHFKALRNGKDWHLIIPKSSGKPEGCVCGFTYPNKTGWVGFFIVNDAYRGKGLGREVWKVMEESFRESKTEIIGLDGVEEQVKTYQRRGFIATALIPLMSRSSLKIKPLEAIDLDSDVKSRLMDIKTVDGSVLTKLDLEYTGLDRPGYWVDDGIQHRKDTFGLALAGSSPDQLRGLIFVRDCEEGQRFGPLYAETYADAKALLYTAMIHYQDSEGSMIAEIFGSNTQARGLFKELGWESAGLDYHRMWLNGKATKEQQEGGKGVQGMYATFDACAG